MWWWLWLKWWKWERCCWWILCFLWCCEYYVQSPMCYEFIAFNIDKLSNETESKWIPRVNFEALVLYERKRDRCQGMPQSQNFRFHNSEMWRSCQNAAKGWRERTNFSRSTCRNFAGLTNLPDVRAGTFGRENALSTFQYHGLRIISKMTTVTTARILFFYIRSKKYIRLNAVGVDWNVIAPPVRRTTMIHQHSSLHAQNVNIHHFCTNTSRKKA